MEAVYHEGKRYKKSPSFECYQGVKESTTFFLLADKLCDVLK